MIVTWIFIITLNLPSFGGPVIFTGGATTYEWCDKLRERVIKEWVGDEKNINGTITKCQLLELSK